MTPAATYPVLLVEDDSNDWLLLGHAFAKSAPHVALHHVRDGVEAQEYLSGKGVFADRARYPLPGLLLLDLKLPRKNGLEVLQWIKEQPALHPLRIIVLTSSEKTGDIDQAYELGASSFLVKSVELRDLTRIAEGIETFVTLLGKDFRERL